MCVCFLCLWPLCVPNNRIRQVWRLLGDSLFQNKVDFVCVIVSMFSGLADKNASVDFTFSAPSVLSLCQAKLN